MKQWVVGWILLCCPLVWADLVVVQKVEESGPGKQTGVITLKTKGDKIRVDLSPEISLIMDTTSGETITLKHGQKTYLSVSSDAARQLARKMERQRETQEREGIVPAPVRLEPTGKRENIAGQATQIYTAQSGAVKMKYWIAQNSPDTGKFLDLLALLRKAPMVQLAGGLASLAPDFKLPGIPLKTEMSMPDGRKVTTTIVSIQEEPLENLDFTVPPGYRSLPKPKFGADPPLKSP